MRRYLFIVGIFAAAAVRAQTITITGNGSTTDTLRFNAGACNDDLTITWTSTLLLAPTGPLQLWSTEGECGDSATGSDVRYTDVPALSVTSLRTGNFTISIADLPSFKYSDAGVICGSEGIEKPQKICGSFLTSNGLSTSIYQHATSLNVIYDTLPPTAPSIDAVNPQDNALKLQFTASSDTFSVHFEARAQGDADFSNRTDVEVSNGTGATITDLVNDTTYDLRARAEDAAGNLSEYSEIVSATPIHTSGFWTKFRQDGGTEQGCSAVAGIPIVFATGLWLMRRKRNR